MVRNMWYDVEWYVMDLLRARRRRWRSIGDHNLSWFGGMVDSNDDIGYIFRVSLPRIFHLNMSSTSVEALKPVVL